jgi:hypothetical protein
MASEDNAKEENHDEKQDRRPAQVGVCVIPHTSRVCRRVGLLLWELSGVKIWEICGVRDESAVPDAKELQAHFAHSNEALAGCSLTTVGHS